MSYEHGHESAEMFSQRFWDERYAATDSVWSTNPNPHLVEQAAGLTPGTALDIGSGEGADAIWLAGQGWQVTGLDISTVALDRAAERAARAGAEIAARISWHQADLLGEDPDVLLADGFDLVSAQYMHLPRTQLQAVHRRLVATVRPGGTLLIVGHHPSDRHTSMARPGRADMFFAADEIAATLDPTQWQIDVAEAQERQGTDPDGRTVAIRDSVLRAHRRAEQAAQW